MALTLLDADKRPAAPMVGGLKRRFVDITFDSSYPTGGEALTAATLGLTTVVAVIPELSTTGYVVQYDRTNSKLKAFYANNDGGADGPLIEVANTTDLSAETVRVEAIGT